MTAEEIASVLLAAPLRTSSERFLQASIEDALASRTSFQREVILSARDRIDFIVGRIGIEVKVQGGTLETRKQLARYTRHTRLLDEVLLVTTRATHTTIRVPHVRVLWIAAGLR